MKDVRIQEVVRCGHFSDKEDSSDADVRTFWCKNFEIFEIYVVSARTREVEPKIKTKSLSYGHSQKVSAL